MSFAVFAPLREIKCPQRRKDAKEIKEPDSHFTICGLPFIIALMEINLALLPSVDAVLRSPATEIWHKELGAKKLAELAREVIAVLRAELRAARLAVNDGADVRQTLQTVALERLAAACRQASARGVRRVINATGVIIHTNLGRAPLATTVLENLAHEAGRYCTLEYDLTTGQRGPRGGRVTNLLAEITGAEAALVVNNCAAAALLVLTALAQGGVAIVSRGELVEIGGDFRVPDVMAQSGVQMIEVGTTNRTKLRDYAAAITENTRLLLRVHPSNYRVVGFTAAPELRELAQLAHERGLLLYEDAGSGALIDLRPYGLGDEPMIAESIAAGADIVTFSGDKLLGGVQAGCIVGRRELIDKIRRHPLFRALRADKLILSALEMTLEGYQRGTAQQDIPVLQMLAQTPEQILARAQTLLSQLDTDDTELQCEIIAGHSALGGGAAPLVQPPTFLLAVTHRTQSSEQLAQRLRQHTPPVIARQAEGRLLLDLRTVDVDEEAVLLSALRQITKK